MTQGVLPTLSWASPVHDFTLNSAKAARTCYMATQA